MVWELYGTWALCNGAVWYGSFIEWELYGMGDVWCGGCMQ
jgi:hypothetical protein